MTKLSLGVSPVPVLECDYGGLPINMLLNLVLIAVRSLR